MTFDTRGTQFAAALFMMFQVERGKLQAGVDLMFLGGATCTSWPRAGHIEAFNVRAKECFNRRRSDVSFDILEHE